MAWTASYLFAWLCFGLGVGWRGSFSSNAAFLALTGTASGIALVIVFLPIVMLVPPDSRLFGTSAFALVGAAAGLVTFAGYFAWFAWPEAGALAQLLPFWPFAVYAAVVGATAAVTYALLLRQSIQRAQRSNPRDAVPGAHAVKRGEE